MGTTNCLFGEDQELLYCQNLGYFDALCVCVCVFKGYFVFTPNEKIPPLFQNYKGKEISKAPSVYLVISKEKMYVCVWVYTEAYMCIPTHTHTHKVHTVYGSSNM